MAFDNRSDIIASLVMKKRKVESDLLVLDEVVGVGVGYSDGNGATSDRLAVQVFVDRDKDIPVAIADYKQTLPISVFPVTRPGFLPVRPKPGILRDTYYSTIVPGIQIQAAGNDMVGTLGAIVYRISDARPHILSNWHIMAAPGISSGIPIYQPQISPGAEIGTLSNAMLGATRAGWLDAAIAEINDMRPFNPLPLGLNPPPMSAVSPALLGLPLIKSGRTTEVTRGQIGGIDVSFTGTLPGVGNVLLQRQMLVVPDPLFPVSEISDRGDSGSVWLDASTNFAVGLHVSGETSAIPQDYALATPIGHVNRTFDIRFGAVDDVPRIWRWWNPQTIDHYYTRLSPDSMPPGTGYELEADVFTLFQAPAPGLTLIYEWWNPRVGDHFYTTDPTGELAPDRGYTFVGDIGYICQGPAAGLTALYRWWNPTSYDHFYTTDPEGEIAGSVGYIFEALVGWVQPLVGFPATVTQSKWNALAKSLK